MSRRRLSDQQVHQIHRYHAQGWSSGRIAVKFGLVSQTVRAIVTGKIYAGPNHTTRNQYIPSVSVRELPRSSDPNAGRSYALAPER